MFPNFIFARYKLSPLFEIYNKDYINYKLSYYNYIINYKTKYKLSPLFEIYNKDKFYIEKFACYYKSLDLATVYNQNIFKY